MGKTLVIIRRAGVVLSVIDKGAGMATVAGAESMAAPKSMRFLSPSTIMLAALAVSLAAAVLTLFLAGSRPWIGVRLTPNADADTVSIASVTPASPAALGGAGAGRRLAAVEGGGDRIELVASDLVDEPDALESYDLASKFRERQTRLTAMLARGPVRLHLVEGATGRAQVVAAKAQPRPILTLPPVFWVQLLSGLAGFLIGVWIWSLRPGDLGAAMFALSGVGLLVSALPAAIYSTRELAIDGALFLGLATLNHLGTHLFGGAMIALFLSYPRRLVRPNWLIAIPAVLGLWMGADMAHLTADPVIGMYLPILVEMAMIVVLALTQWWLAGRDPAARAALRWLGLSVVIGAGAFVVGVVVPVLMGFDAAISQGYAFGFFLLIYLGIALGIRRYRLFELGEWAYRILFYTAGALLLLALDVALIWMLQLERGTALGLSLLVIGFIYLPLRDVLWRRMYRKRLLPEHELFSSAMQVAFAATRAERAERWRELLARLYEPLEITLAAIPPVLPTADADGLALTLPAVADSPALRLRYPFGGKGIFGRPDLQLANHLVALVGQAETSRDAYERGVQEERQRSPVTCMTTWARGCWPGCTAATSAPGPSCRRRWRTSGPSSADWPANRRRWTACWPRRATKAPGGWRRPGSRSTGRWRRRARSSCSTTARARP